MSERFDAVVIGAGPGGEHLIERLRRRGLTTALVERELIGGECGYWGCIPSKTLIRPAEVVADARRAPGISEPSIDWAPIARYRDWMTRDLDDSGAIEGYEKDGIRVFKAAGRIAGPGRVAAGDEEIETDRIVIATGSESVIPPVDGLDGVSYWTNREATQLEEIPDSVVVLGAGVVGVELGQMLSRYGSEVVMLQAADRLFPREDPDLCSLVTAELREEGIDVRIGARASAVREEDGMKVVTLEGGDEVRGSELLVATGRKPRVEGLGLESAGVELSDRGAIKVDERCRAADGVWAIGDVTGIAPFTHVAKYQGRIVLGDIAGEQVKADYGAIPRVTFCDPEVGAIGPTPEEMDARGLDVATSEADVGEISRSYTWGEGVKGRLRLFADRRERKLIGAWAVGPVAGEWIHAAQLAIKAGTPIDVLKDLVPQFPTFTEAYLFALEDLEL